MSAKEAVPFLVDGAFRESPEIQEVRAPYDGHVVDRVPVD